MRRIRSRRFALLMVVMLLLTTLLQGGVVFAAPGANAIWTTDEDGIAQDANLFPSKQSVYVNFGSSLPIGNYYFEVEAPGGDVLGTGNADVDPTVNDGRTNLFLVTSFADTTNTGGEYKVTFSITVTDDNGRPKEISKSDNFKVGEPEIDIEKSVEPEMAMIGDTVIYTLVVTNTGNVDLEDVMVEDPMFAGMEGWDDAYIIGELEAGDDVTIEVEYTIGESFPWINTATATGVYEVMDIPQEVSDSDSAEVAQILPGISIEKTVDPTLVIFGAEEEFREVTYTFLVTNTGNADLEDVMLSDPMFEGMEGWEDAADIGKLKVGDDITVEFVVNITPEMEFPIMNTATVTGYYNDHDFSDEDDAIITNEAAPAITLQKVADKPIVTLDDTMITYHFTVTNTGNTDLVDVVVNDPMLGEGPIEEIGTLAASSEPYEFDEQFSIGIDTVFPLINEAEAVGYYNEEPVTAEVSEQVDLAAIELTKNVTPTSGQAGDEVMYIFTAENIGTVSLFDIMLEDATIGYAATQIASSLEPGATTEPVMVPYVLTSENFGEGSVFINTAMVTGDYDEQQSVSDEASAEVAKTQPVPAVSIDKSVNDTSVRTGTTVTYTIKVTNIGSETLFDLLVKDVNLGFEQTIPSLEPGAFQTFSIDKQLTTGDRNDGSSFVNTATVDVSRFELHEEDSVSVLITSGGGGGGGGGGGTTTVVEPEPIPEAVPEIIPAPEPIPEPEPVIFEEAIPQAVPVLPKTGELPPELFYGLGGMLAAIGVYLKRK